MIRIHQIHDSQLNEFKLLVLKTEILTILVKTGFNRLEELPIIDNMNKILLLKFVVICISGL